MSLKYGGQVLDLLFSIRIPSRYAFDKYLFSRFDDRVCRYIFFWLYDTTSVAGNLFRQIINERYNINLINDPKKDALATVNSNIAVNNRVSSEKKFMFDSIGHAVLCVNDSAAHMGEKIRQKPVNLQQVNRSLQLVLVMRFSSCIVIILLRYHEWVSIFYLLSFDCAHNKIN